MTFVIDDNRSPDRMRLCPSCRMEISVLATKCRYCGEEVGRPKEEQRQLTVESMGGEHIEHYAPSSSVMEALESFRSEEVTGKAVGDTRRSSIFRRKKVDPKAGAVKHGGLPELDAQSQQLAGGGQRRTVSSRIVRASTGKKRGVSVADVSRWAAYVAAAAVAIAGVVYGGSWALGALRSMRDTTAPVSVSSPNPAARMLEDGEPIMEVLAEAALYHRRNGTPESEKLLNDVRARVVDDVRNLLNGSPFDRRNLRNALRMINEASQADPSDEFVNLKREVDEEIRVYATMLIEATPDSAPPTAVFRVSGSNRRAADVRAAQGETILDGRFRVDMVRPNYVHLIDLQRNNRRLRAVKLEEITAA